MKEIIPPVARELLEAELTPEKFQRKTNKADNEIYILTYFDSPNLMREIGRLRELTFRSAGGGIGEELDIDSYDFSETHPYKQLIVWDPANKEILGGLGTGSGSYKVHPWFYDYFTSGDYTNDYRGTSTFLTNWNITPTSGTKYVAYPSIPSNSKDTFPSQFPYINKYKDPKGLDASDHENDFFVLRLAEVYLIRAEAQNEYYGSPSAAPNALSDINQLRARARNANITTPRTLPLNVPAGLSQNDFRKKIFDERGIEFIGEGKRWFDLVRMKGPDGTGTMYEYQFKTFLPTLPQGLPVYDRVSKSWSSGRVDPLSIVPFNSKYLLFPIPQSQRDLNNKLTQNSGW